MEYLAPCLEASERRGLSTLALAHVGDAVYEVMVRTYLCTHGASSSKAMHRATVERVSAPAQARAAALVLPLLTEEEQAVFRRGRNSNPRTVPRTCTREEYGYATALEALWGDLFLAGRRDRLQELFDVIVASYGGLGGK